MSLWRTLTLDPPCLLRGLVHIVSKRPSLMAKVHLPSLGRGVCSQGSLPPGVWSWRRGLEASIGSGRGNSGSREWLKRGLPLGLLTQGPAASEAGPFLPGLRTAQAQSIILQCGKGSKVPIMHQARAVGAFKWPTESAQQLHNQGTIGSHFIAGGSEVTSQSHKVKS